MKLPIVLKSNEFVVLVTVDIDPKYELKEMDPFYASLPKSFKPIFQKMDNSTIRVYCISNNEDDLMFCLRQTGYKTTLL
ncbi:MULTISPECIES: hypothetical protein [unclassified Myroides]|uniref:hypothetical protein n=1 Tax=unclassified Myroides TaxID=2642485 RepID=UPI0015FB33A1|nr:MULTISPECIES: hypothetical protein [unclassified Myroides]MBB1150141.1 hypothetical protein [Myroides sp. NP-2]MDM1408374.1 hypothetical protein [Myroides sp. DF42-4-2]